MVVKRRKIEPDMLDPRQLTKHPMQDAIVRPHREHELAALIDSIGKHGAIFEPVVITGEGCASPPGTVLSGHGRTLGAIHHELEVPVARVSGLTREQEITHLVKANLVKHTGRKLLESEIAAAEKKLRETLSPGRGSRKHLRAGKPAKTVLAQVAESTNSTTSATKDRAIVIEHPVSTPVLIDAVDSGAVPRSIAAKKVRELAATVKAGAATEAGARTALDAWVAERGQKKTRAKGISRVRSVAAQASSPSGNAGILGAIARAGASPAVRPARTTAELRAEVAAAVAAVQQAQSGLFAIGNRVHERLVQTIPSRADELESVNVRIDLLRELVKYSIAAASRDPQLLVDRLVAILDGLQKLEVA